MKRICVTFAFALMAGGIAGPSVAGSPESPGAGGKEVAAQAQAGDWGTTVSGSVPDTDSGDHSYAAYWATTPPEGRPDPANDQGGGND